MDAWHTININPDMQETYRKHTSLASAFVFVRHWKWGLKNMNVRVRFHKVERGSRHTVVA
jgi:hypothetical protein